MLLALAAVAALAIDMPVARAFRYGNQTPPYRNILGYFDLFEYFGHGFGVAVLVLAIHQLDPGRRWALPRVVACLLASGGLADLLKMSVLRIRPYERELPGSVWTTFEQWLPLLNAGSGGQSFPSAHTATACGFAAALIWLYPQGRLLFSVLAVLAGCQRIVCEAHYPSDVLAGAAAGCFASLFLLKIGLLPIKFSQWEEGWRSSGSHTADKGRESYTESNPD